MREVRIWFTDFWADFDPYNNYFIKILSTKYKLVVSPDNPEFLFFSWCSEDFFHYKDCVRIYFTGENLRPDYTICDYSISFDYDSFDERNIRLPLYVLYGKADQIIHKPAPEIICAEKTKFCNFIYSNERAKERKEFFDLLNTYKKVDSGGKVFNNIGYRVENKIEFIKDYKFTIAFENSSYRGYTTEKIFEPMTVHSIPIYWGNPNVKEDFNTKSFINVHDYGSLNEVVDKVKELDQNTDAYVEMLSQPFLRNDEPSKFFDENRLLDFFEKIFLAPIISRSNKPVEVTEVAISIIIPVFNTEQFLVDCLNSVLNQGFKNYEIICVNDGSTDKSAHILENYQSKHTNLNVIYQDNQGLSAARNTALNQAIGKYILFLDSDDMLVENALDVLFKKAELMELDVLGFNYSNQDGNVRNVIEPVHDKILDGRTFFMLYVDSNKDFPLSASCLYFYNRDFLQKNNLVFKPGLLHEDEHFFIRLLMVCEKIYFENQALYIYRMNREDSIINLRTIKKSSDLILIARELFYHLKMNSIKDKLFYRKIYQLYQTAIVNSFYIDNNKAKIVLTKEDKYVLRSCIQNFNHFYYYSLISKDVNLFKWIVIKKKSYIFSKIILWAHKLYYYFFADKYRMN